jgi:hypothetical protein
MSSDGRKMLIDRLPERGVHVGTTTMGDNGNNDLLPCHRTRRPCYLDPLVLCSWSKSGHFLNLAAAHV